MSKTKRLLVFRSCIENYENDEFKTIKVDGHITIMKHLASNIIFSVELSDARVNLKLTISSGEFLKQTIVNLLTELFKPNGSEVVIYNNDNEVALLADANQLYVYSSLFDITDSSEMLNVVENLLTNLSLALSLEKACLSGKQYMEGQEFLRLSKQLERSSGARDKAIELHGLDCLVCGLNFEKIYGDIGKGFIHVHHLTPISKIGHGSIDPETDLVPLCANCHAMLHKFSPPLTPNELCMKLEKTAK